MGSKGMRGRHRSTDKEGRKAIERLQAIPGVRAVIIGHSIGGKSIASGSGPGIRLQREVPGGFKGVIQSSKGIQEVFIQVEDGKADAVAKEINGMG